MNRAWTRLIPPLLVCAACALGCAPDEPVSDVARISMKASAEPQATASPSPTPEVTTAPTPTPTPTPYVIPSVAVNPTPPGGVETEPPSTHSIPL